MVGIFLFTGAIAFILLAVKEQIPYMQADTLNKNIREKYVTEAEPEEVESKEDIGDPAQEKWKDPMNRKIDFEGLQKINTDIVAWIYIPGTNIDFPVCKGKDNQYYLNHDFEQRNSKTGTVFVPEDTKTMEDAHIIFYGHTPGMFGTLVEYQNEMYQEQNNRLYVYTPNTVIKCVIANSNYAVAGDGNYNRNFELNSAEYEEWISEMDIRSGSKQVFTLSTCTKGNSASARYVVRFVPD